MTAPAAPSTEPFDRPATAPVDLLVDWRLAARTAAQLAGPGPQAAPGEAAEVVGRLRAGADEAVDHVARVSRLSPARTRPVGPGSLRPDGADNHGQVLVVDRAGWARNNATSFRNLLEPIVAQAFSNRVKLPSGATAAIGSRLTGAQVGALLGYLAGRVLGQYDPFAPGGGRLLLIAPNVLQVQRELAVPAADFALWVCLHEQTHRLQFTATPWLADHLRGELRQGVSGLVGDPDRIGERLAELARGITDTLRGLRDGEAPGADATGFAGAGAGLPPLIAAVTTPEQRERLARITAVMSLLEGHADVVMDDVGPEVLPSVTTIRERFTARRAGRNNFDRVVRRLLGLEAKLRQYADGARFVRGVQQQVGVDGFNAVWSGPEQLPLPAEIADPAAWVRRVHG